MSKRFPSNILQSFILLFAVLLFFSISLFINEDIAKQFLREPYNTLLIPSFGLIAFSVAYFVNRRNGFLLGFNFRLVINWHLGLVVLALIAYQMVIGPIIDNLSILFDSNQNKKITYGLIYYIGAILLGPIFEELIFRGVILNGMLDNYKNSLKAILLSSLIFGLIHVKIFQIITAFIMGLVFGYFFYKTRSILLCIILHSIVNASGSLTTIIHPLDEDYTFYTVYGEYSWAVFLLFISILIFCGFSLFAKHRVLQNYLKFYA